MQQGIALMNTTTKSIYRANAVYIRVPHFMSHSGYELVSGYVGRPATIVGTGEKWPRAQIFRYPQAIIKALSGLKEYSFGGLALELSTIARMARARDEIFHFLYGEHFCRYTPFLNGWRGNKVIASFHQTPAQLEANLKYRSHLKRLAAVIILGQNQRQFFEQIIPDERIFFVPHGVDTAYFQPASEREAWATPFCLCVGGNLRDFDTLREAIKLVNASGVPLQFEAIARLDQAEAVQGLPNVRVRDWVSEEEMLRLYQQADVLVLSFCDAVASNMLLEGMACGAPLVVTDVGAVRDYVSEREARLVPPQSPSDLAAGIIELVANPDQAVAQGRRARQRSLQLDHQLMALRLKAVYAQTMAQPVSGSIEGRRSR